VWVELLLGTTVGRGKRTHLGELERVLVLKRPSHIQVNFRVSALVIMSPCSGPFQGNSYTPLLYHQALERGIDLPSFDIVARCSLGSLSPTHGPPSLLTA